MSIANNTTTTASNVPFQFVGPFVGMEDIIRITPNNEISVFDFVSVVCKQTRETARSTWKNLFNKHQKEIIMFRLRYARFGKKKKTLVFPNEYTSDLVKLLLPGARLPVAKKQKILKDFGLNHETILRSFVEEDIHEKLRKALAQYKSTPQFPVLNYRIDLYFPDQKLAVECDEHDHKKYNNKNEEKRTKDITAELGNSWIRYDPYDKDFDIFCLIHTILIELSK
jgi:very-short-patch-repair endonuclease